MAKGLERVEVGTSGEVSAGSPRGDDGGRLRGQQLGDRKWGQVRGTQSKIGRTCWQLGQKGKGREEVSARIPPLVALGGPWAEPEMGGVWKEQAYRGAQHTKCPTGTREDRERTPRSQPPQPQPRPSFPG